MVAYTDTLGFNKGSAAIPAYGHMRLGVHEIELDFAAIAAARAAAGVAALGAADTLEILPVSAGTVVLAVVAQVVTAEGATATMDLGDSGSATRYFSNTDLNATGYTASALDAPYVYTANGFIRATIDSASVDVAVVRFTVLVLNAVA